jgi:hypothetical protein
MSNRLLRCRPSLVLPDELPVHGNEEFLAVLSEAGIPADGLDHVQGGLIVAAGDRKIAEQSGQGARLQLQGTLQVGNICGDRQRAPDLPLRHGRLAHPGGLAKFTLLQPTPGTGLDEHAPELVFLRCSRQGCSLAGRTVPRSMAHLFFVAVHGARQVAYNDCQIAYRALPPPVSNEVPHDG